LLRSMPVPEKKHRAQPLHHSKGFPGFCKRSIILKVKRKNLFSLKSFPRVLRALRGQYVTFVDNM
jgi:hypothetical protein